MSLNGTVLTASLLPLLAALSLSGGAVVVLSSSSMHLLATASSGLASPYAIGLAPTRSFHIRSLPRYATLLISYFPASLRSSVSVCHCLLPATVPVTDYGPCLPTPPLSILAPVLTSLLPVFTPTPVVLSYITHLFPFLFTVSVVPSYFCYCYSYLWLIVVDFLGRPFPRSICLGIIAVSPGAADQ